MTADEVIRLLELKPLEMEGGYFRRTYENMDGIIDCPRMKYIISIWEILWNCW